MYSTLVQIFAEHLLKSLCLYTCKNYVVDEQIVMKFDTREFYDRLLSLFSFNLGWTI